MGRTSYPTQGSVEYIAEEQTAGNICCVLRRAVSPIDVRTLAILFILFAFITKTARRRFYMFMQ
jgi:hypothetical protein